MRCPVRTVLARQEQIGEECEEARGWLASWAALAIGRMGVAIGRGCGALGLGSSCSSWSCRNGWAGEPLPGDRLPSSSHAIKGHFHSVSDLVHLAELASNTFVEDADAERLRRRGELYGGLAGKLRLT